MKFMIACATLCVALHSSPSDAQLAACAAISNDSERLACYDAIAGRTNSAPAHAPTPEPSATPSASPPAAFAATEFQKSWELDPKLKRGTFNLLPYRPVYALAHATSNINNDPSSPTRSSPIQDIHLERVEAKLQFSFKTKIAENLFGGDGDLWFGYTQQSYWQAANGRYSSPFRESNYQPEAIFVYPLRLATRRIAASYVGASLTHESNGRGQLLSRSWNRLVGEVAVESGPWAVHVRPWLRIDPASGTQDDNPDIEDFVGRGEIVAEYRRGRHVVTLTGRHTLRGGAKSRGSGRLDWAFPLAGNLHGHVQFFTGYGESLVDYNHSQTTFGLGVSFFD